MSPFQVILFSVCVTVIFQGCKPRDDQQTLSDVDQSEEGLSYIKYTAGKDDKGRLIKDDILIGKPMSETWVCNQNGKDYTASLSHMNFARLSVRLADNEEEFFETDVFYEASRSITRFLQKIGRKRPEGTFKSVKQILNKAPLLGIKYPITEVVIDAYTRNVKKPRECISTLDIKLQRFGIVSFTYLDSEKQAQIFDFKQELLKE